MGNTNLTHRYLWGTGVDQILADEQVHYDWSPEDYITDALLWPLGDHLGSVRDVVDKYGTVRIHRAYDAYGNITSQELRNSANQIVQPGQPFALQHLFAYTARPFDADTLLQNNLHRWYDAPVGRWLTEDPIGFEARDGNLYRYCGNVSTSALDPSGTKWCITRSSAWKRGHACGSKGDTVADLARRLRLEADNYRQWLRAADDKGLPETAHSALDEDGRRFRIPNTVFVGIGNMSSFARWSIGYYPENVRVALLRKDYYVVFKDWKRRGRWDINDVPAAPHEVYGLVIAGHGEGKGGKPGSGGFAAGWLNIANDAEASAGYVSPPLFNRV